MNDAEVSPADEQTFLYQGELSPADKVVISYLSVLAALVVIAHNRVSFWWAIVAAHAAAILLIIICSRLTPSSSGARVWRFIRGWYPVALVPVTMPAQRAAHHL